MKTIFILQNSNLSFGLDARKTYQPEKYNLNLIVNEFGYILLQQRCQTQYYNSVTKTDDFTFQNLKELIKQHLENSDDEFDIVTNAEEAMPVCGKLRVYFDIDNEDYSRFYNKDVMKLKLSQADFINIPKYKIFNYSEYQQNGKKYLKALVKNMKFPVFCKPIQLYGSVNLKKVGNLSQLEKWAKRIGPDDTYEIDEYIDGVMYHCDSYIKNRQVLFTFVSQNSRPCYDFTVGKMKGTIVLPPEHEIAVHLSRLSEKILLYMGIPKAGITHLELLITKEGKVYFVEIAHRSPGCLIPRMYQAHANIDTIAAHFLLQIDEEYVVDRSVRKYAAWACYPKIPGVVKWLDDPPNDFSSAVEVEWFVKPGEYISSYSQFGRDYTGTLFMTNCDFTQLYNEFVAANNMNLCKISS